MKVEEYKSLAKQRKYRNTPTERVTDSGNVIKFASQKEAARYDELMLMLKAGEIRKLKIHPQYTLIESYTTPEGEKVKREHYTADFSYILKLHDDISVNEYWQLVVEDVKSEATRTASYLAKTNRLLDIFGISVTEV